MKTAPHTWICAKCDKHFLGTAASPPPGWKWRGELLLCDDCSAPTPRSAPRPAALAQIDAVAA